MVEGRFYSNRSTVSSGRRPDSSFDSL
jgi:hypothetical protein